MSFFDVFSEMLVILFCMAAGFLAHKLGYLSRANGSESLPFAPGYHCALPDFRLRLRWRYPAQYRGNSFRFKGSNRLLWAGLLVPLPLCPACWVERPSSKCVWRYSLIFSNMAFIGYPVSVALFGQEALFYAVILVLPFNLLSYSHRTLDAGRDRQSFVGSSCYRPVSLHCGDRLWWWHCSTSICQPCLGSV